MRKAIGILAIFSLSALSVYFGQNHFFKPVLKGQAEQIVDNTNENNIIQITQKEVGASVEDNNPAVKDGSGRYLATIIADSDKVATTIEEAQAPVPIVRDKNPATRLDEARLYTKPQILMGKYIDISLAHQNMVLFQDGNFVDAYLISSGKRGLETPQGTFKIENKVPRAWSKRYGLFMPNWMALIPSGAFGIHELPEWPGGYKEGASHLGVAVSHGCVRLGVGPAKRVYDWAEVGTPVIVHK